MPAYVRRTVNRFVAEDAAALVGLLEQAYAADGFASQYTRQTRAWADVIPVLQDTLSRLSAVRPEVGNWTVLIEYPLYRLRRRIDIVIFAENLNLCQAACCKVLVVNGGAGCLFVSFFSTDSTI